MSSLATFDTFHSTISQIYTFIDVYFYFIHCINYRLELFLLSLLFVYYFYIIRVLLLIILPLDDADENEAFELPDEDGPDYAAPHPVYIQIDKNLISQFSCIVFFIN